MPGDPSNNSVLSASPAFGGIDVRWTYPGTNPHALSYVKLYRGSTSSFGSAILIAEVGGSHYYDKQDVGQTFYYWIQIVSINGTVGDLIGPASASARPLIADLIEQLTGEIDNDVLANSLKTEIGKIASNYGELQQEILDRIAQGTVLSSAISDLDDANQATLAYITQEMTTRANGDDALAQQIDAVQVLTDEAAAAVVTEQLARIAGDDALATRVDSVEAAIEGLGGAAVEDILTAKIGYSATNDAFQTPYDGDGATIVYPVATYPTATFPEYAANRTRIIDKVGVTNWNATPAGAAKPLIWIRGMPLASAVKRVGVIGPDGTGASLESAMSAQATLNNGFKAMYTMKLAVGGLVGGFGLYNDGITVDAGFDVDRFWIGRTNADKRKPFIVQGGEVFIDQAVINKLTFSKLTDESGAFVVQDGKVKADYISGRGLTITDSLGNILLNAGTSVFTGNVTGQVGGTAVTTLNTNVSTALTNASNAQTSANNANTNATNALNQLTDISNDGVLSRDEKPAVIAEHTAIVNEYSGILASGNAYARTSEVSTYTAAYNALISYLGTLTSPTAWNNTTGNTTVVRTTFNSNFTSYYNARQLLLNAIASRAKELADAAQASANSANSGLLTRLRSDAQNILSGPGGLATGNLTWDTSGNRTGGFGVGFTQQGIVAFNSLGQATFTLNGTTGAATFAGVLSAATGTFAGSLSAATGTFSGTLTAGAINAVNTINIAGEAVVATRTAAGNAATISVSITVPAGETWNVVGIGFQESTQSGGLNTNRPATGSLTIARSGVSYAVTVVPAVLDTFGVDDSPLWGYISTTITATDALPAGSHVISLTGAVSHNKTLVIMITKR